MQRQAARFVKSDYRRRSSVTVSVVDCFFCDEYIAAIVYIGGSGDDDGYRGTGGVRGGCVGSCDVYVMSFP